jgi:hypothetical protein
MRWALAFALLATLALLTTAQEAPTRAARMTLALQYAQRRAAPPADVAPATDGAAGTVAVEATADGPVVVAPGRLAVQVIGADDRPAAGVCVTFRRGDKNTYSRTDERGVADFDPAGASATAKVGGRKVELLEPLTVVRLDTLVPVTAVLVDAATGTPLATPCRARPTHVLPADRTTVEVEADAPRGYVFFERSHPVRLARSAREALLRVPARPEARLAVRVRTAGGKPARGVVAHEAAMGADRPTFIDGPEPGLLGEGSPREHGTVFDIGSTPAGANGLVEIHGVPFLQGEKIGLTVRGDDRYAWVEAQLPASNDGCTAEVRLPPAPNHPALESRLFSCGCGCGGVIRRVGGTAAAELLVYRRDGTPAAGVRVRIIAWNKYAQTDESGVARFEKLPAGRCSVAVLEPGFTRAEATFELAAGKLTRVRIDEPAGWTTRVLVLDEWGHRVPFAKLAVEQLHRVGYADLADGVHDLVRYTNQKGEAELARLSDGPIDVTARFGTRHAKGRVEPGTGLAVLRLGAGN